MTEEKKSIIKCDLVSLTGLTAVCAAALWKLIAAAILGEAVNFITAGAHPRAVGGGMRGQHRAGKLRQLRRVGRRIFLHRLGGGIGRLRRRGHGAADL